MRSHPVSFTWQSRIRFVDTDASGRIHYSALFRHFEAAEFEFLRALGHSYSVLDEKFPNLSFPRIHVEADYLAALRADDEIAIQVSVARIGGSSFTLAYTVMRGDVRAATGKITAVCTNIETGKSQPLPAEVVELLRGN